MWQWRWMVVGLAWVSLVAPVSAQPQPPVVARQPAFSPYLNLLRGGINPAINYYGLVRPQQFFQQQALSLQQQVNQNNFAIQSLGTSSLASQQPMLPYTGHPVVFNSFSGYFNNLPIGGGRGVGVGGSPAFITPPGFGTFSGVPASSVMSPGTGIFTPGFVPRGNVPATGRAPMPNAPNPAPSGTPGNRGPAN